MATRDRKPRPDVTIAVSRMSQYTAHLWGFKTERSFLEFVQRHNVPRAKVGKTTFIKVADFERALDRLETRGQSVESELTDRQPQTADEVLAVLGLERIK